MDPDVKLFTVEEAEHALEQAAPLVETLQALAGTLRETQQQIEDGLAKLSHGNGHPVHKIRQEVDQFEAHQRELAQEFEETVDRLQELGCLLKDLETGLLDFYSMRDGEMVFLCWKLGEDRIRFWHGLEDGFAGRQPLP